MCPLSHKGISEQNKTNEFGKRTSSPTGIRKNETAIVPIHTLFFQDSGFDVDQERTLEAIQYYGYLMLTRKERLRPFSIMAIARARAIIHSYNYDVVLFLDLENYSR